VEVGSSMELEMDWVDLVGKVGSVEAIIIDNWLFTVGNGGSGA